MLEFKPGEKISAKKLSNLAKLAEGLPTLGGGEAGNFGQGYNARGRAHQPRRFRGLATTTFTPPANADGGPGYGQGVELVWVPERKRLVVVSQFRHFIWCFDPDLIAEPGFYIKWEDMGDGLNELYYTSCNVATGNDEPAPP